MDTNFLLSRVKFITNHQSESFLSKKEKQYYLAYASKIIVELEFRSRQNNQVDLVRVVEGFNRKESYSVTKSLFFSPKKALDQACRDACDVIDSLYKCDGYYGGVF